GPDRGGGAAAARGAGSIGAGAGRRCRVKRHGSTLVEVLIALSILVSALLVMYGLLHDSFRGFRRLDRREMAEAASLTVQDRYFHMPSKELLEKFGKPGGGREEIEHDALVDESLPHSMKGLKQEGFQVDAWAIGLDQGNGSSGLYFTTKVS